MADISLLANEFELEDSNSDRESNDNSIEDWRNGDWITGGSGDCDSANFHQNEDTLSPRTRLEKYALSANILYRQMVPSILLEIFRDVNPEILTADIPVLMEILSKVADDTETAIRADLVQRIPHLAAACAEYSQRVPALGPITTDHLLPLVVKYLGDSDSQVRKSTYTTLLALMEQGLVPREAIERHVCPKIIRYTHAENMVDYQTGAVTLMTKMVPLLGREITERLFLKRFAELCINNMFYIRKICSSSFGDYCAVVGREAYETVLLPCFIELCNDEVWGVRKACAEVIMTVSCACSPESRKTTLANAFARLLQDQSRWVRESAFQTLGPFISTFADPSIIGLTYNQLGELVLINPEGTEFRLNSPAFTDPVMKKISDTYFKADAELGVYRKNTNFNFRHNSKTDNNTNSFENQNDEYPLLNKYLTADWDKYLIDEMLVLDNAEKVKNEENQNCDTDNSCPENNTKNNSLENITENNPNNSTENSTDENSSTENNYLNSKENITENNTNNSAESNRMENNSSLSCNGEIEDNNSEDNNIDKFMNKVNINIKTIINDVVYDPDLDEAHKKLLEEKSKEQNNSENYSQENSENNIKDVKKESQEDDLNQYSANLYWYISPELPLDPNIVNAIESSKPQKSLNITDTFLNQLDNLTFNDTSIHEDSSKGSTEPMDISSNVSVTITEESKITQTIVPQMLIDHFVSMTDIELAENLESDMAYHCAFSLPAVALTLGRDNWHLLKRTCEILAADMHYKVRKTVASSLHELALILGQELADEHLVPIFDGFIKDLDEVRIGVLKHLAHFLKLIGTEKRNLYVPRLVEFLQTDNEWNWRFREEFAKQLLEAVPLFSNADELKGIGSLVLQLLHDKVFAVRQIALQLLTELVRHISVYPNLLTRLLIKLAGDFAHSKLWVRRQAFAHICSSLVSSGALPPEKFATDVMPHLLDLSWDPVPNVRLAVSRTIARHIIVHEYFMDEQQDSLQTVLRRMQSDKDRDVRHYALTT